MALVTHGYWTDDRRPERLVITGEELIETTILGNQLYDYLQINVRCPEFPDRVMWVRGFYSLDDDDWYREQMWVSYSMPHDLRADAIRAVLDYLPEESVKIRKAKLEDETLPAV